MREPCMCLPLPIHLFLNFVLGGGKAVMPSQAATCNVSKVNLHPVCSPHIDAPLQPCSTCRAPLQVQAS